MILAFYCNSLDSFSFFSLNSIFCMCTFRLLLFHLIRYSITMIIHHSSIVIAAFYISVCISILVANHSWSTVGCFLLLLLRVTTANTKIFRVNYGVKFHGIEKLQRSQLSPYLISPQVLQICLDEVCHNLVRKYPSFHLAFHHIPDFYNMDFVYVRQENFIFMTLKIPITPHAHKFSLFRITTFPMPLHNASAKATQLLDVSPFLAVCTDRKFWRWMMPL